MVSHKHLPHPEGHYEGGHESRVMIVPVETAPISSCRIFGGGREGLGQLLGGGEYHTCGMRRHDPEEDGVDLLNIPPFLRREQDEHASVFKTKWNLSHSKVTSQKALQVTVPAHLQDERTLVHLANAIEQILPLLEANLEGLEERFKKALIETVVQRLPIPPEVMIEAQMEIEAKQAVFNSCHWYEAKEWSQFMGSIARNPSDIPNKLKKKGAIFSITHRGRDLFPSYALNKDDGYQPYAGIKKVLDIFEGSRTGWELAYWFFSENGYLDGDCPQKVFNERLEDVLAAARSEVNGVMHG